MVGHCGDVLFAQQAIGTEGRHLRDAGLGVGAADAVVDGLLDVGERAAPDPVVVDQDRIAGATDAAGAVAGRAVLAEDHLAAGLGELQQVGVLGDVIDGELGELVVPDRPAGTHRLQGLVEFRPRCVAEHALGIAA